MQRHLNCLRLLAWFLVLLHCADHAAAQNQTTTSSPSRVATVSTTSTLVSSTISSTPLLNTTRSSTPLSSTTLSSTTVLSKSTLTPGSSLTVLPTTTSATMTSTSTSISVSNAVSNVVGSVTVNNTNYDNSTKVTTSAGPGRPTTTLTTLTKTTSTRSASATQTNSDSSGPSDYPNPNLIPCYPPFRGYNGSFPATSLVPFNVTQLNNGYIPLNLLKGIKIVDPSTGNTRLQCSSGGCLTNNLTFPAITSTNQGPAHYHVFAQADTFVRFYACFFDFNITAIALPPSSFQNATALTSSTDTLLRGKSDDTKAQVLSSVAGSLDSMLSSGNVTSSDASAAANTLLQTLSGILSNSSSAVTVVGIEAASSTVASLNNMTSSVSASIKPNVVNMIGTIAQSSVALGSVSQTTAQNVVSVVGQLFSTTGSNAVTKTLLTAVSNVTNVLVAGTTGTTVVTSADSSLSVTAAVVDRTALQSGISSTWGSFADPSGALSSILGAGTTVTGQLITVATDVYISQTNSSTQVGRSQYVGMTLYDSNNNEISVQNLATPLVITLPITNAFAYTPTGAIGNTVQNSCTYWDTTNAVWSSDGCTVASSNATHVNCACNHLTTFSVLFTADNFAPNALSLQDFANAYSNIWVDLINAVIVGLLVIASFFALRHDRALSILFDAMDRPATKMYRVTVQNGQEALSHVEIKIGGELYGESVTFTKLLEAFALKSMSFAMPDLGELQDVTITVQTNGPVEIRTVTIVDMDDQVSYAFLGEKIHVTNRAPFTGTIRAEANRWIAVDYKHRFASKWRKAMPDRHIWASIFTHHKSSPFSTAERVLMCFFLLVANAAVSLAWYKGIKFTDAASLLYKLILAIITNGMVFAFTFPFIYAFLNARKARSESPFGSRRNTGASAKYSLKGRKQMLKLAYGWRVIATLVLVISFFACLAVASVQAYLLAMTDNNMTTEWVKLFFITLLESLVLSQPLLVTLRAAFEARRTATKKSVEQGIVLASAPVDFNDNYINGGGKTMTQTTQMSDRAALMTLPAYSSMENNTGSSFIREKSRPQSMVMVEQAPSPRPTTFIGSPTAQNFGGSAQASPRGTMTMGRNGRPVSMAQQEMQDARSRTISRNFDQPYI